MTAWQIESFDVRNASTHEYRAANDLTNRIRAEMLPDDPPIPLEEHIHEWQNIPAFIHVSVWGVWNATHTCLIASGVVNWAKLDTNRHLAEFNIQVLPEFRRQGIARALLAPIIHVAQVENRTLLLTETTARIPAGAAFMQRLGARKGLENHTNQLDLHEVNRDLLRLWQTRAAERATDFELGWWDGIYPEENLRDIVELWNVMNSAPRDALEMEDWHITPEHLRQIEQQLFASGKQRWTLYVREKSTGQFAGYTEVFWNPHRPYILTQGATGVFPQYRNQGLGRWLKATMLERVLRERPEVRFVRTGNADSNAAMLKINQELGFKPYLAHCVWQVETTRVEEYWRQATGA